LCRNTPQYYLLIFSKKHMELNKKTLAVLSGGLIAIGGVASIGAQAFAQTAPVAVSTTTGGIVKEVQDAVGGDKEDVQAVLPVGGISETVARASIATSNPTLTVKHIKLEDTNGTVAYSAKLSDGSEVSVDVKTGAVTKESDIEEQGEPHHGQGGDQDGKGEHGGAPETETGSATDPADAPGQ
jgi:hypothetical protein